MISYILIGSFLTVTVVVPAIQVFWKIAKEKMRPARQGRAGEAAVNRRLRKFRGKSFARAKDVMLPAHDKTSQIDNMLISPYGIFVIETKNYSGKVEGSPSDSHWTHFYPDVLQGSREFLNPIWQNHGHIKALRELLKDTYPKLPFYNVVAFSNLCLFPEIENVVAFKNLPAYLGSKMQGEPVLSDEDVAAIKKLIDKSNIKGRRARSQHVANVKTAIKKSAEREKDEKVKQNAEAAKQDALKIQQLFDRGYSSLDSQIISAKTLGSLQATVDKNKEIDKER